MLDRDRLKELHNSVTELHKTTSLAATGSGSIDWEGILDLTINILTLIKSNFSTMHTEFRRSMLDKPETINEASQTRQEEHKEFLNKNNPSSQPAHPNLPRQSSQS